MNAAAEVVPLWNGLSITTLGLAVVASVVSLVALRLTYKRDHPEVHWTATWDKGDPGTELSVPAVRFMVNNRGQGVARDVKLFIIEDGGAPEEYSSANSRAFGEGLAVWLTLTSAPAVVPNTLGMLEFPRGEAVKKDIAMRLEWSQEPDLHKRPSKTWKYKRD